MHDANRRASVSTTDASRLRTLIVADAAITAFASAFVLLVFLAVEPSPYLLFLAAAVLVSGGVMAIGLRPLVRGDTEAATAWLSIANWSIAVVAGAVATFAWPIMVLAALLPSVFAMGFVERSRLRWYVLVSFLVALGVTALGLLQDFSGLSDDVPEWVTTTVLLVFTPLLGALVAFVALQSSVRLEVALDEALGAQRALEAQADELRRSRARIVVSADRERRRIERDLHDGAQQRLVAINMRLAQARNLVRSDPDQATAALDELRRELHVAHHEIRDLAHGVYPPVLTRHGLVEAVQSAADRTPLDVRLELGDVGRHHPDIEAAVYFCVVEALQNTAKHARSAGVNVSLGHDNRSLWFEVEDHGIGFDALGTNGDGLTNMRDRLGSVGGVIDVETCRGSGTRVRGVVPVAFAGPPDTAETTTEGS